MEADREPAGAEEEEEDREVVGLDERVAMGRCEALDHGIDEA